MRFLISGITGLIGTSLKEALLQKGHFVAGLSRRDGENLISWDISSQQIDVQKLENFDIWIHLAGESIAGSRWTEKIKRQLYESRIQGTQLLTKVAKELKNPPKLIISASAIGFYGDRGSEVLTENSSAGQGFLAQLCVDWEKAAQEFKSCGAKLAILRTGIVLSKKGGALAKILPPFKLGLGGKLGSGRQYMSWIHEVDAVNAILSIESEGIYNIVGPSPCPQEEFGQTLAKHLGRPFSAHAPEFLLKMSFGEMAKEMLLASARVEPKALSSAGFRFQFSDLSKAFQNLV